VRDLKLAEPAEGLVGLIVAGVVHQHADLVAMVQQRGGHDGVEQGEAGQARLLGPPRLLPDQRRQGLQQLVQDVPAGAPGRITVGGDVGGLDGLAVRLAEQHPAGVQADDLNQGLGGAVEEIFGADGALDDAKGAGSAVEQ